MERIHVIGMSMTPFGRCPDQSIKDLTRSAVIEAFSDAGCGVAIAA